MAFLPDHTSRLNCTKTEWLGHLGRVVEMNRTVARCEERCDHATDSGPSGCDEVGKPPSLSAYLAKDQIEDWTREIEFLDPGAQPFAVTLG
jgi:hypothetical protein